MIGSDRGARRSAIWCLKLVAGLLLFWIAFRDIDSSAVGRAFANADVPLATAGIASTFVTVACVTIRWQTLLGYASGARGLLVLGAAVIASQVANIVMPFRLGDAVRIGAVSRSLSVPPAEILASVAAERLFDALLVALTAGLLASLGALPPFARAGMLAVSASVAITLVAALIVVRYREPLLRGLSARAVGPIRVREWVRGQSDDVLRGLRRLGSPSTAAASFAWSAAVMAGSIFTAWLVMMACRIDAPATAAAVVVVAVQIGSVAVPIPGAVGISQVLTVQTLRWWGIDDAAALAYALALYLVSRVPKMLTLPLAMSLLAAPQGRA